MPFLSYASVSEADDLAEFRVGGAAWLALTDEQKEMALATATRDIDTLEDDPGFLGERTDEDQPLAFPRDGDTEYPDKVIEATFEYSMTLIPLVNGSSTGDPLNQDPNAGNVKREVVGPLETEYFAAREGMVTGIERLPAMVQRLLSRFLVPAADGSAWGSAVVTRGS